MHSCSTDGVALSFFPRIGTFVNVDWTFPSLDTQNVYVMYFSEFHTRTSADHYMAHTKLDSDAAAALNAADLNNNYSTTADPHYSNAPRDYISRSVPPESDK